MKLSKISRIRVLNSSHSGRCALCMDGNVEMACLCGTAYHSACALIASKCVRCHLPLNPEKRDFFWLPKQALFMEGIENEVEEFRCTRESLEWKEEGDQTQIDRIWINTNTDVLTMEEVFHAQYQTLQKLRLRFYYSGN
jgi:hypothetical protein